MDQVGVDSFAEFTATPRGGVPVEDPQHVPGSGSPGAKRVKSSSSSAYFGSPVNTTQEST